MNSKNISWVLVFVLLIGATQVYSQPSSRERHGLISIKKLESLWSSKDRDQVNLAAGYITGTLDGMTEEQGACIPTQNGLVPVWKRIMQEMPNVKANLVGAGIDLEKTPANVLVMAAAKRAYGCRSGK